MGVSVKVRGCVSIVYSWAFGGQEAEGDRAEGRVTERRAGCLGGTAVGETLIIYSSTYITYVLCAIAANPKGIVHHWLGASAS